MCDSSRSGSKDTANMKRKKKRELKGAPVLCCYSMGCTEIKVHCTSTMVWEGYHGSRHMIADLITRSDFTKPDRLLLGEGSHHF